MIIGGAPVLPTIVEDSAPELSRREASASSAVEAAPPELPPVAAESAEPPPVGWHVTERGTHRIDTDEVMLRLQAHMREQVGFADGDFVTNADAVQ